MKIGITGQAGFMGWHLNARLALHAKEFTLVPFERNWFEDADALDKFVSNCDVIVHLAALNRHHEPEQIFTVNTHLVKKLIDSLEKCNSKAHVILSSSTQEERDNIYGKSKREGRLLLADWAEKNQATFTGTIIPNVFGPFGKPFYNSVVATFSHQLAHGETPQIEQDANLSLIYVEEWVEEVMSIIRNKVYEPEYRMKARATITVSALLNKLKSYHEQYFLQGFIPLFEDNFELHLFNTYRSFISHEKIFPRNLQLHSDERGAFAEVIRTGSGGQSSYSTTLPGITRGNHFHTRKIERFTVIKGKARISIRKTGTDEVQHFYLDGNEPAYVDMPIWYTHNITNIGDETLYTLFWINEYYNPNDPDTWMEVV